MADIMFKLDSPIMNFLNKLCDVMILNILVLVFSIPVFTIGASVTAGYYMCFKMVRNEESYMVKGFWKAFKDNFKQSTAIWLIILVAAGFLFADYRIVIYSGLEFAQWIRIGLVTVTVIIALGISFVFAVQARFSNTVKNTIRNAFLMALSHLPSAILFVASYAVPVLLIYFFPQVLPVIVLLAVGGVMYGKSFLFLKIFKRYEDAIKAKESENSENESEDSGIFAESEALEIQMSENAQKKPKAHKQ